MAKYIYDATNKKTHECEKGICIILPLLYTSAISLYLGYNNNNLKLENIYAN